MKAWKKCVLALLCLCVTVCAAVPVRAAEHIKAVSSSSDVEPGGEVCVTVSLEETALSSLGVEVICGGMEVVSAQWLQSGLMASFDLSRNKGVFSPGGETLLSGEIFRVTLKAVQPGSHTVSVKVIGKNGANTVFEETVTRMVKVPCQSHSWDEGRVLRESTCAQSGEKGYSCTLCGQTRTEALPLTGHQPSEWITDREAAVGAEGSRHVECTLCHTVLKTEAIPALAPAPTEPVPTEPAPTEPAPTGPAPTEPAPTEPAPAGPAPTEPAPTEPAPTEPAPSDPVPTDPVPTEPVPTEPAPTDPVPTEPAPSEPKPAENRLPAFLGGIFAVLTSAVTAAVALLRKLFR